MGKNFVDSMEGYVIVSFWVFLVNYIKKYKILMKLNCYKL